MSTGERLDQVRQLRERGLAPKQIAKTLGIGSAEASRLVRAVAAAARTAAPEPRVVGCWVSPTWSTGLTIAGHPEWPRDEDTAAETGGMVAVLVAREHRYDKIDICGYLVDVYCLGLKNIYDHKVMDEHELRAFVHAYFDAYHGDPIEAPIELAREIVFGAIEYARGLGFEPHPGWPDVEGHLGSWSGPSVITFGNDGKPFYIDGPYDNSRSVIRTLERTVGAGNFEYIATAF
ncbi:helix-turn-helix domain-containing protein [Amycolatopsis sp. NPDC058986]|uniref:helix-turn-helix domain-containing protein n=1 Tax=unclassified Amycolatopsis TaxID=2618356 RepID=UPI00366F44C8